MVLIMCGLSFLFINCNEDPISVSELIFDPDVSSNKIAAGESTVFTDYSTGVKSRFWSFPGGTPETSTEEEVSVSFDKEGPITCKVEVTFLDDFTETKEFVIQVGNELYGRDIFSFEDTSRAIEAWKYWVSDESDAMVFTIENSPGNGANGTDNYAKIAINKANVESQLYTKGNANFETYNAILESNKTYEFSFWVKSDDYTQFTASEVSNENDLQSWYNFLWYSPVREISNVWTHKTATFETGDLSQIYPENRANNTWSQFKFLESGTGIIYIDEISLREIPQ